MLDKIRDTLINMKASHNITCTWRVPSNKSVLNIGITLPNSIQHELSAYYDVGVGGRETLSCYIKWTDTRGEKWITLLSPLVSKNKPMTTGEVSEITCTNLVRFIESHINSSRVEVNE